MGKDKLQTRKVHVHVHIFSPEKISGWQFQLYHWRDRDSISDWITCQEPGENLGHLSKGCSDLKADKEEPRSWLRSWDKSGLPGKFKAWMYQYGILPRILWSLFIYEVPTTMIDWLEKNINKFALKWLRLPQWLSSIALFGQFTKLHLPFSDLFKGLKVFCSREVIMYRDSAHVQVASAGITVKIGRKWQAHLAIRRAEAREFSGHGVNGKGKPWKLS